MDGENGWGITHLATMPITLSFGVVLAGVLVLLLVLRLFFGDIKVSGGAGVK